jgi:hypothetical protein
MLRALRLLVALVLCVIGFALIVAAMDPLGAPALAAYGAGFVMFGLVIGGVLDLLPEPENEPKEERWLDLSHLPKEREATDRIRTDDGRRFHEDV